MDQKRFSVLRSVRKIKKALLIGIHTDHTDEQGFS